MTKRRFVVEDHEITSWRIVEHFDSGHEGWPAILVKERFDRSEVQKIADSLERRLGKERKRK